MEWNRLISELGVIFPKGEKALGKKGMTAIWSRTFVKMYLDYDMTKEFLPQFKENASEILTVMCPVLMGKCKRKGGK